MSANICILILEGVSFSINSPSGSKQKLPTDEKAEESVAKKRKYSGAVP